MLALMVDAEVDLRDLVDLTAEVALEVIDLMLVDLVVIGLVEVDLEVIDVLQVVLVDVLSVKWLRC